MVPLEGPRPRRLDGLTLATNDRSDPGGRCPLCREGLLAPGISTVVRRFDGVTYTVTVPAEVCPHCSESLVTSANLRRAEAAIARALVTSGAQDGATLQWLRKVAGLRAVDLAELLGVAVETVSRWENDRTAIDRPALHTLGELAVERGEGRTTTADALRAMAGPHGRQPKRVMLAMG